jgi:hypothetical protein
MTYSERPDDINRIDRELTGVNRRLDRLEYTQITPQEFNTALDRIYEEITASGREMRAEILAVNAKLDSLDAKFNILMKHITGDGQNPVSEQ